MFGRTVKIDGTEFWVWCTPDTPYSEVLRRAAAMAARDEAGASREVGMDWELSERTQELLAEIDSRIIRG